MKWFNWLKRKKNLQTHMYIQLTPIPFDVIETTSEEEDGCIHYTGRIRGFEEMGDEADKIVDFLNGEREALEEWVGLPHPKEDESTQLTGEAIHAGFETGFTIWHTRIPEDIDFENDCPRALDFYRDVFSMTVLGDTGSELDGQRYTGRCRWVIPYD